MIKCKSCSELRLPKITRDSCGEDFGQLQLVAFVDLADTSTLEALTAESVKTRTTWTGLMAGENPKVVISPILFNPAVNAGGEREWGGGNATPDGKTYTLGKDPTELTAELRRATGVQQKEMEELQCMAEADRLGIFLFDGDGRVMAGERDGAFAPIKAMKVFVSDRTMVGADEPDYNALSIQMEGGWSAGRKVVDLDNWRGADLILATLA